VGALGMIMTSSDGEDWSTVTSGVTVRLSSVIWAQDRFVIVGAGNVILTSP